MLFSHFELALVGGAVPAHGLGMPAKFWLNGHGLDARFEAVSANGSPATFQPADWPLQPSTSRVAALRRHGLQHPARGRDGKR